MTDLLDGGPSASGESSGWATETGSSDVARSLRIAVGLLGVIAALLVALTFLGMQSINAADRLLIEQKRETCYERLAWLSPDPRDSAPLGLPRESSARHCEGDDPLTEFND